MPVVLVVLIVMAGGDVDMYNDDGVDGVDGVGVDSLVVCWFGGAADVAVNGDVG